MALALCAAASVSSAQLTQGFPLDTERVIGPDLANVGTVRTAFAPNDSLGLAVWGLRACRVLASGAILDSIPFITDDAVEADGPTDVASLDGAFVSVLVVVPRANVDSILLTSVHVAQTGEILRHTVIDSLSVSCEDVALATDGTDCLLAWLADRNGPTTALCTRLDEAGRPVDSMPILISEPGAEAYDIDMVYGDSSYLAIWVQQVPGQQFEVLARLLNRDGSPVHADPVRIGKSSAFERVAVSFNGRNFVVIWCDEQQKLRIGRVSQSGQLLDPDGVVVATDRREYHDISSVDGVTLACWVKYSRDTGFVRACRYDTALVPLDSAPIDVSPMIVMHSAYTVPSHLSAVGTRGEFVIAWSHISLGSVERLPLYGNTDAVFRRLTLDGQLLDTTYTVVSNSANSQLSPSVASDGRNSLAAWTDYRPGAPETMQVRGVLMGPDGRPLSRTFAIGAAKTWGPCVAYGGGCYLVVWSDSALNIECARVSTDGALLDSTPTRLATSLMSLGDVKYGGGLFLVLLGDKRMLLPWGVRVSPDGVLLDTVPRPFWLSTGYHASRLAGDGHGFMVVSQLLAQRNSYVYVRVDSLGALLDTEEVVIAEGQLRAPLLTYGGGYYFVTNQGAQRNWRVTAAGVILDSAGIPSQLDEPVASCFDGTDFLLVARSLGWERQLKGERIGIDGTVRDTASILLVEGVDWITRWGICADSSGNVSLTYEADSGRPYQSARARAAVFAMPSAISEGREQPVGGIVVSPNPASHTLTLDFAGTGVRPTRVELFDAAGRRVKCVSVAAGAPETHLDIDVRGLPGGVYFVVAETESGRSATKVVVQH